MTTEEAYRWLYVHFAPCGDETKQDEAVNVALKALEKQIPRKAIGEHYAHMRCPSCNHRIPSGLGSSSRRRDNWCNYCGQRIEWEDEG
jgi:DNA-directed RNA polymerase subunit RPC12/RpoP